MGISPERIEKELIMAKLNTTRTIAAALLGTVVLAAPVTSFAQDFRTTSNGFENCRVDNRNNQVVGGLIGAVAGGVLGSQVAGTGARTEGSYLGAALGAAAGVGLASRQSDCRTVGVSNAGLTTTRLANNRFGNNRVVTTGFNNRSFNNNGRFNNRGFSNSGFGVQTVSYGHSNRRVEQRLYQIDREIHAANLKIEKLEYEEIRLKKEQRYAHNQRSINARLREIDYKINVLKDCKRDLKREARNLKSKRY